MVGSDLLRAAAALSVPLGVLVDGWIPGALFLLVLGGTMLPRALGAPAWLDATHCSVILFAGWAAILDLYRHVLWLDLVIHGAATGLVAVMVLLGLSRLGAVGTVHHRLPRQHLGVVVVTSSLGLAGAVLWELGEWFGHTFLDGRIRVGYGDTVGDLAAGAAGSLLAGLLIARFLTRPGDRR